MFTIDHRHRLDNARHYDSPNADERPDENDISLVVIHGISLPPERPNTQLVVDLFLNQLDVGQHPALADLAGLRVSSHLLLARHGKVIQFVPFNRRAWHAGKSSYQGRDGCNDYAIGIELEGSDHAPYAEVQYRLLVPVLHALFRRYPALSPSRLVGHAEIAPGRKTDPGPAFDWPRLLRSAAGQRG